jgi:SlyX protein
MMSKTEENIASSMSSRLTENETKISFLIKDIEDLSDIVARQGRELEQLTKQVSFLAQKETERDTSSGIVLGDKPPHW